MQHKVFSVFNNPGCFPNPLTKCTPEKQNRCTPAKLNGHVALVGKFTDTTANDFFTTFKTDFVNNAMPMDYKDRILYFDSADELTA